MSNKEWLTELKEIGCKLEEGCPSVRTNKRHIPLVQTKAYVLDKDYEDLDPLKILK